MQAKDQQTLKVWRDLLKPDVVLHLLSLSSKSNYSKTFLRYKLMHNYVHSDNELVRVGRNCCYRTSRSTKLFTEIKRYTTNSDKLLNISPWQL